MKIQQTSVAADLAGQEISTDKSVSGQEVLDSISGGFQLDYKLATARQPLKQTAAMCGISILGDIYPLVEKHASLNGAQIAKVTEMVTGLVDKVTPESVTQEDINSVAAFINSCKG